MGIKLSQNFNSSISRSLTEMTEMKSASARDQDAIDQLRKRNAQLQENLKAKSIEYDILEEDLQCKEDSLQKQMNIVTLLNNEILEYQQELEKERRTVMHLSHDDHAFKQFEKRHEFIHQSQSDKSVQTDQSDIDDAQEQLRTTVEDDMQNIDSKVAEKLRRIKELDALLYKEKNRCRELETKLKVVVELKERDAHLHIQQLGQTDAEFRKARTDTERVRILQQQLDLKQ